MDVTERLERLRSNYEEKQQRITKLREKSHELSSHIEFQSRKMSLCRFQMSELVLVVSSKQLELVTIQSLVDSEKHQEKELQLQMDKIKTSSLEDSATILADIIYNETRLLKAKELTLDVISAKRERFSFAQEDYLSQAALHKENDFKSSNHQLWKVKVLRAIEIQRNEAENKLILLKRTL